MTAIYSDNDGNIGITLGSGNFHGKPLRAEGDQQVAVPAVAKLETECVAGESEGRQHIQRVLD